MELMNATRMPAAYTLGVEPSGRELLVVAIKGTFVLPRDGEGVRLADVQVPLLTSDVSSGAPGYSAVTHECDFAARKPMCDVLLVGSAYAPLGRQVTRLNVGLQVGPVKKQFDVVGDRVWSVGLAGVSASPPEHFRRLAISYDTAFGGADRSSADVLAHDAYLPNPVGKGWHPRSTGAALDGLRLPNTERSGEVVTAPNGSYAPMAFGVIGRGWPLRARHAGTYDQAWLERDCPFLPRDFDDRYFQAAPLDQQMPVPDGPVQVVLKNLTPDGERRFQLPAFEAAVHVFPKRSQAERHAARLDTIVIEPDDERLTLTWRLTRPLARGLQEIAQLLVGRRGASWWQQREDQAWPGSMSALLLQAR